MCWRPRWRFKGSRTYESSMNRQDNLVHFESNLMSEVDVKCLNRKWRLGKNQSQRWVNVSFLDFFTPNSLLWNMNGPLQESVWSIQTQPVSFTNTHAFHSFNDLSLIMIIMVQAKCSREFDRLKLIKETWINSSLMIALLFEMTRYL